MPQRKYLWLSVTFLFALVVAWLCFAPVITAGGHAIPDTGGDPGKNIFAYLYHTIYDKGFWFTGMNYPYGEQILYTDGQPLLSVLLGYLHVPAPQALGIMWLCIILSYVLAVIYVYKILVHFGVKPIWSMLFAGIIIIQSPQLFSTQGHFGLSYACTIPMLFYWTLRYYNLSQLRYPVYIFLLALLGIFLHPYLGALALIWVAFYSIGYILFAHTSLIKKLRHVLPLVVAIAAAFMVFKTVLILTDPYNDRPKTPYGLVAYCTRGEHIFTSPDSPIWKAMQDHGLYKPPIDYVGFSYLGIVAILTIVISLFQVIISYRRKHPEAAIINSKTFSPIWVFLAFAALLLAMGVPFVWQMEWLVQYLSFMKQFRTLSRFSWIFYYIATVYAVVIIYRYHARLLAKGKQPLAYFVIILSLVIWSIEASGYITSQRRSFANSSKAYDQVFVAKKYAWSQWLASKNKKASDFQSILLLRFFNVGTDKLWLGKDISHVEIGAMLEAGMQLHLPAIDAMMARASWGLAMKQVKTAGGPYVYKPMLDDLPNNKPFLLLHIDYDELDPDQKYLLSASDHIGKFNEWEVYACYPDRIKANDKKNRDSVLAIAATMKNGADTILGTGSWYINHYDSVSKRTSFFGWGAQPHMAQHETVIATVTMNPQDTKQLYEFSCWFLLEDKDYSSPILKLDCLDPSGNLIYTMDVLTKESTDNNGMWFRSFAYFTIPDNCHSIRCRLLDDPENGYLVMDEVLLRPSNSVIISKGTDGRVLANNHLISTQR